MKIQDLQQKNETLEDVFSSLQCNSFPEAVERLQQLRGFYTQPSKRRELTAMRQGRAIPREVMTLAAILSIGPNHQTADLTQVSLRRMLDTMICHRSS